DARKVMAWHGHRIVAFPLPAYTRARPPWDGQTRHYGVRPNATEVPRPVLPHRRADGPAVLPCPAGLRPGRPRHPDPDPRPAQRDQAADRPAAGCTPPGGLASPVR